jgi:hypothetical protein
MERSDALPDRAGDQADQEVAREGFDAIVAPISTMRAFLLSLYRWQTVTIGLVDDTASSTRYIDSASLTKPGG